MLSDQLLQHFDQLLLQIASQKFSTCVGLEIKMDKWAKKLTRWASLMVKLVFVPTFLISSSLSSLSMKNLRYWYETSMSQLPPLALCSSTVWPPPLNAYLLIWNQKNLNDPICLGCPRWSSSGVYLVGYLLGSVGQEYWWVAVRSAHFAISTLQGWEKGRMDQGRFWETTRP